MWQRSKIITVMLLWAACYPLLSMGLPYAQHMAFASLRALLSGFALIILALLLKRAPPKTIGLWGAVLGIGLGATTLGFWGMFHASEFVSPGMATIITNTQPVMAAFLAHYALNEKLGLYGKIGITMAFLGIVLIAVPQIKFNNGSFSLGLFYIFVATIGITISNILIRFTAKKIDALWAMGLQLLLGSIPLVAMGAYQPHFFQITWSIQFILSLLALSLIGTAFAYWLWFDILTKTALNQANIYSFLIPIFGLLFGILFYQERFGYIIAPGILMTISGISLVNFSRSGAKGKVSIER